MRQISSGKESHQVIPRSLRFCAVVLAVSAESLSKGRDLHSNNLSGETSRYPSNHVSSLFSPLSTPAHPSSFLSDDAYGAHLLALHFHSLCDTDRRLLNHLLIFCALMTLHYRCTSCQALNGNYAAPRWKFLYCFLFVCEKVTNRALYWKTFSLRSSRRRKFHWENLVARLAEIVVLVCDSISLKISIRT